MIHQVNIFLLLFGALQGVLLSLWFFRNQRKNVANLYMGLFLFVIGLQLTLKVITKGWMMEQVLFLYISSYQLPYLAGPLIYLYIKSKKDTLFHKRDLLHFLPFILAVIMVWVLETSSTIGYYIHPLTSAILQTLSLGIYAYLSVKLAMPLQKAFILITVAAQWIIILTLAIMVMYNNSLPDIRLLFVLLTLLIYYISYQVIARSALFVEADIPVEVLSLQTSAKYAHSSLKATEADRIEKLLKRVMAQEKLFLDSSLSIDTLSAKLSTSRHHLSQVLNDRLQKSYTEYMNELRVEEARSRLSDPANARYTIAAIAYDCGFNSIATFNEVFKKHYQTTPSKFRQILLKKMRA